jgi:putative flippase GtrA
MWDMNVWRRNHPRLGRWSDCISRLPLLGTIWSQVVARPREVQRFLKFAAVGALGAMVDFALLNLMKSLFEALGLGMGWRITIDPHQVQLVAANTISFSAAVLSNFTWNRLWTFPESRGRPLGSQLAQFAVVNILGWGINTLLLLFMDQHVFQHFVSARLSYNLAKAVAIGVVLFWNFGINRIWTYRGIE